MAGDLLHSVIQRQSHTEGDSAPSRAGRHGLLQAHFVILLSSLILLSHIIVSCIFCTSRTENPALAFKPPPPIPLIFWPFGPYGVDIPSQKFLPFTGYDPRRGDITSGTFLLMLLLVLLPLVVLHYH